MMLLRPLALLTVLHCSAGVPPPLPASQLEDALRKSLGAIQFSPLASPATRVTTNVRRALQTTAYPHHHGVTDVDNDYWLRCHTGYTCARIKREHLCGRLARMRNIQHPNGITWVCGKSCPQPVQTQCHDYDAFLTAHSGGYTCAKIRRLHFCDQLAQHQPSLSWACGCACRGWEPDRPHPDLTGSWRCAWERGTCACKGGQVTYGIGDRWTPLRNVSGSIPCTNQVFGDPIFGKTKMCMCTFNKKFDYSKLRQPPATPPVSRGSIASSPVPPSPPAPQGQVTIASTRPPNHRPAPSAGQQCNIVAQMRTVNQQCCTDPSCHKGMPANCNTECAAVFLPFWNSCKQQLQQKVVQELRYIHTRCEHTRVACAGAPCHNQGVCSADPGPFPISTPRRQLQLRGTQHSSSSSNSGGGGQTAPSFVCRCRAGFSGLDCRKRTVTSATSAKTASPAVGPRHL